ncbi:MAG: response regulator [Lachnospiraceae bacterium]|nr:response regulator [Lachnospiraceae bacterium]
MDFNAERIKFGHLLTRITYLLVGIVLGVVNVVRSREFTWKSLLAFVILVVTFLILRYMERSPLWVYAILQNILFGMLFINAYFQFGQRPIAYLEAMLLLSINISFLSPCVLLIQFLLKSAQLIGIYLTSPGFDASPFPLSAMISIEAVYLISTVIAVILCRSIANEQKRKAELEQSLDDLILVIEAKVDDARAASRSRADFLSNMSHEIRTPINSILGMNTLIMRESRNPAILKYASDIRSSGKLLLSIINDILDFSKIERKKMDIVPTRYDLRVLLTDLSVLILPMVKEKNLEFNVKVNPRMPKYLSGDDIRIKQVILNLLTNAVKYTDEGSVTLSVDFIRISYGKIYFRVEVSDTGRGIREEDLKGLFEAFRRTDEKKNRNIQGTGLGLSIADNLVRLMGGLINVESTYGEGTSFSFGIMQTDLFDTPIGEFNLGNSITRYNHDAKEPEASFIAPGARVLVVDDNMMNVKVAKGLLKRLELRVDSAESGPQCIEMAESAAKEGGYDIILLDHMMPDMDGMETFEELRKRGFISDTPVIALTANAIAGAKEMFLDHGFTDYLSKPIESKVLEAMIRKYLPEDKVILRE